ncbi:MAG: hypothetical protein ACRDXX_07725, partial [Stackebrandtia sp.]
MSHQQFNPGGDPSAQSASEPMRQPSPPADQAYSYNPQGSGMPPPVGAIPPPGGGLGGDPSFASKTPAKRPGSVIFAALVLGLVSANYFGFMLLQFFGRPFDIHHQVLVNVALYLLMGAVTAVTAVLVVVGTDFGRVLGAGAAGAGMLNSTWLAISHVTFLIDGYTEGFWTWAYLIWALGGFVLGAAGMATLAPSSIGDWITDKRRGGRPAAPAAPGMPTPPPPGMPQTPPPPGPV